MIGKSTLPNGHNSSSLLETKFGISWMNDSFTWQINHELRYMGTIAELWRNAKGEEQWIILTMQGAYFPDEMECDKLYKDLDKDIQHEIYEL